MSLQYETVIPSIIDGQFESQTANNTTNGELITYYPTWFNGEQQQPISGVFGGAEEQIVKRIVGEEFSNPSVVISGVSGKYVEQVEQIGAEKKWFGGVQEYLVGSGVNVNDVQLKTLINVTYETIVDAGMIPAELRGTRTGVFIGATNGELQTVGPRQQFLAAQLAQVFDFKGPVQVLNSTQSTSLVALDAAVQAIKSGLCDYALVAGVCLDKPVEEVKDIIAAAVFVQKKHTLATRKYYTKVNSFVGKNIMQQIGCTERDLLRDIYTESEIDPQLVAYMPQQQWNKFGSPVSSVPLFTKFNSRIGHEETTTGILALVKMLVQIQRGMIPSTWEYLEPSKEVLSFLNGRFDTTSSTKFFGGLLTLNALCNNGMSSVYIQLQPHREYILRPYGQFYTQKQQQPLNGTRVFKYTIDLSNTTEESYLYGHQIAGRVVYPTTGYLYLIWKSLAKLAGYEQVEQVPITFENVEFHRETYITPEIVSGVRKPLVVEFTVQVAPGTGMFELFENGSVVATGRALVQMQQIQTPIGETIIAKPSIIEQEPMVNFNKPVEIFDQEHIYNELKSRGYEFQGEFQPIIKSTVDGTQGELAWSGKWIPFLGAMLQMNIYGQQQKSLYTPKYIKSIRIDPRMHLQQQQQFNLPKSVSVPAYLGVEIQNEMPFEQLLKWKHLYSQYQSQQQGIVQKFLRSSTIVGGEQQHMRLWAELERLVEEQKQTELFQNEYIPTQYTNKQGPIVEIIYDLLKKQYINHRQQQTIVEKLIKLQQIFGGVEQQQQGELLETLKEIIVEQEQLQTEEQMNDEERFHYMQQLKLCLRQKLSLVQKLLQAQQNGGEFTTTTSTIELLAELERHITKSKQNNILRQERQDKIVKTISLCKKQTMHHLYIIQQLKQQVQPQQSFVKHLIEETEKSLVEAQEYYNEKEAKEIGVCQYLTSIYQRLAQIHIVVQQFVAYKRMPQYEELHAILIDLERLIQTRFAKIVSLEIRKQQEEQIIFAVQYRLEKIYKQVERVLAEKIYRPYELEQGTYHQEKSPRHLIQELQTIMQLKQQLFREFRIRKQQPQYEPCYETKPYYEIKQQPWKFTKNTIAYPVIYNPLSQIITCGGIEMQGIRYTPFSGVDQQQQIQCSYMQEILEHYLTECRRFAQHIMRRIEQPQQQTLIQTVPMPFPKSSLGGEQQLLIVEKSKQQFNPTEFIQEGGKLLQLLIQAANIEQQLEGGASSSYINKVHRFFNEKSAFLRAIDEDRVLNHFVNKRNNTTYLKNMLNTIMEIQQINEPYTLDNTTPFSELVQQPYSIVQKIRSIFGNENVTLKVKDFVTLVEKMCYDILQNKQQIHRIKRGGMQQSGSKLLASLIENMKSLQVEQQTKLPIYLSATQTYIINGSTLFGGACGGFAVELAQWLCERGVKCIVFVGKSAQANLLMQPQIARKIERMQDEYDVQITVISASTEQLKDEYECAQLLRDAKDLSVEKRIGGVFYLDNNEFTSEFAQLDKYKVVRNLDKITRTMPTIMDEENGLFVVITSIKREVEQYQSGASSLLAPTSLEKVCERRRAEGKHAIKMHWENLFRATTPTPQQPSFLFEETTSTPLSHVIKRFEQILAKSVELKQYNKQQQWFNINNGGERKQQSIVEAIAKVMGVQPMDMWKNEQATLFELGMTQQDNQEIKRIIEEANYTTPFRGDIRHWTVEQLKSFETKKQQQPLHWSVTNKHINAFFTVEKLNTVELNTTPLFIIHPASAQGQQYLNTIKQWAQQVRVPVFGVFFTQEARQFETVEQLAGYYWQQIENELVKHTFGQQTRVHLCGAGFGALVAIEMSAQKPYNTVSLSLVEGNREQPSFAPMPVEKRSQWGEGKNEIEIEALVQFVQQFHSGSEAKWSTAILKRELYSLVTLEQRIKHVIRELIRRVPQIELTGQQYFNIEEQLEHVLRVYVQKSIMAACYQPRKQLNAAIEVLLVKSVMPQAAKYNYFATPLVGEHIELTLGQVYSGRVQVIEKLEQEQIPLIATAGEYKKQRSQAAYLPLVAEFVYNKQF